MLKISYLFIFFMLLTHVNAISWESVNNTELSTYNVFSYGVVGDGVTDDTDAFNYAIDNITAGSTLVVSPGEYFLDGLWEIDKPIKIVMDGATLNFSTNAINQGVRISSSGVHVEGGNITGSQYIVSSNTQHGIYAYGSSSANYLSDITIKNINISKWGFYGIELAYVKNFNIEDCRIGYCYQACIQTLSAENGTITGNDVGPVLTPRGGGKYGIALSRNEGSDLVANPRSQNIRVSNNFVHDIVDWEGLETHGGENITFDGNTILHCFVGIAVVASDGDVNGEGMYAPLSIVIVNNVIDWGETDGLSGIGIGLCGATGVQRCTGIISGNRITNHGADLSGATYGAIYSHTSHGVTISGNAIASAAREAIHLTRDCSGFSITGNTILDPWTSISSVASGIYSGYNNNTGYIGGNTFTETGDVVKTHVADRAINIADSSGTYVTIGENSYTGFDYIIYDPGLRTMRGSYMPVSTSGTGTDALISVTIPAETCAGGSKIHVVAWGTMTGTAGNKNVNLAIGTTSYTLIPAASAADVWRIDADLYLSRITAQQLSAVGIRGTSVVGNTVATMGESFSDAIAIKCTGVCADAGDVITKSGMMIDIK